MIETLFEFVVYIARQLLKNLVAVLFIISICEWIRRLTTKMEANIEISEGKPKGNQTASEREIEDATSETAIETVTPNTETVTNDIDTVTPITETVTNDIDTVTPITETVAPNTETVTNNIHTVTTIIETVTPIEIVTSNENIDIDSFNITSIWDPAESGTLKESIKPVNYLENADISRMYNVNGSTFFENQRSVMANRDNYSLASYELYKVENDDENSNVADITTSLDVQVQSLPSGLIINSNVYLTDAQWHTMSSELGDLFRCIVCHTYCDSNKWEKHIESVGHLRNLDKYKPLKSFDLSIVRKINENLHCGVCNELMDMADYSNHENSKTHEGNLLTAINKVSDLMYDSNIHRNDSIDKNSNNIDRNSINIDRNSNSIVRNSNNIDRNSNNIDRNTISIDRNGSTDRNEYNTDRNIQIPDRNIGEFHFDANAINNNMSVYEEFSDNEYYEGDEEEYSYEGEEYSTPCQGISYASMARKPRIDIPKFLKVDLGNKEVRVKFESWHMITKIELNKFYCMVCCKQELMRNKSRHCIACEHLEKLNKCVVVQAFEDYLIRKVDDKLYHCGHCNSLQPQYLMLEHIESVHPKKNRNIIDTNAPSAQKSSKKSFKTMTEKNSFNNNKKVKEKPKTESDKTAIINKNIQNRIERKMEPIFDIFGDVTLTPFGLDQLRISALSYNIVMEKDGGYYCAVCDKVCADVKAHVEELEHFEMMNMTPFIRPFKLNLTRAVRGTLHCGLCNKLVVVSEIYDHNMDQPHTNALANALGMVKNKPGNYKKYDLARDNGILKHALTIDIGEQKIVPQLPSLPHAKIMDISPNYIQKDSQSVLKISEPLPSQPASPDKSHSNTEKSTNDVQKTEACGAGVVQSEQNKDIVGNNQKFGQKLPNAGKYLPIIDPLTGRDIFQNVFARQNQVGQNNPNIRQNHPNTRQNHPNIGQNHPNIGQNHPNIAQNHPNIGQNHPNIGQNHPNIAQNHPNIRQNHPNIGQNHLNSIFTGQRLAYGGQMRPNPPQMGQNHPNTGPNSLFHPLSFPRLAPAPINTPFLGFNPYPHPYYPGTNHMANILNAQNQTNVKHNQNLKGAKDQNANEKDKTTCEKARTKKISEPTNGSIKSDSNSSVKDNISSVKDIKDNIGSVKDNINSVKDNDREKENSLSEDEAEQKVFDVNELVFLKLKTTYFKITHLSYHTLVYLDNGIRHCFVCSNTVRTNVLQKHIDGREHTENIAKTKFLDKYGNQLFRQMYLMYHCAICNVLMTRKEIKLHLEWPIHIENYDAAHKIINKKNRKKVKSGIKEYVVEMQKEAIFHNVNEPKINIVAAYQIVPDMEVKIDSPGRKPAEGSKATVVKKNKMVILNNAVMKVCFDHWHGITSSKNITRCIICQLEIRPNEVLDHVQSEYHGVALGKTFEKTYYPALVRKINEITVNCVICNLELPNDECMLLEHFNGRKHKKNHDKVVNESSNSDSYADCYEEYLNL